MSTIKMDESMDIVKKRRRSILKDPAEKRVNRDSRTVSFYEQLQAEDMEISVAGTLHDSAQMDLTLVEQFANTLPDSTAMSIVASELSSSEAISSLEMRDFSMASETRNSSIISSHTINNNNSTSNKMSLTLNDTSCSPDKTLTPDDTCSPIDVSSLGSSNRLSCISSFADSVAGDDHHDDLPNETSYGAFHDSNISNQTLQTSTGMDTLVHNIEALNDCIAQVDQEVAESRQRLDDEMNDLFRFYRHTVNKDNKYEFAIAIFGLNQSLWLILKLNPDKYPNEKIDLKFAVSKKDRHLYPFPEFAKAVKGCTREGTQGYLTRFVINAQKFRRFLRTVEL